MDEYTIMCNISYRLMKGSLDSSVSLSTLLTVSPYWLTSKHGTIISFFLDELENASGTVLILILFGLSILHSSLHLRCVWRVDSNLLVWRRWLLSSLVFYSSNSQWMMRCYYLAVSCFLYKDFYFMRY